jgi:3alpha(or 20beta)-hydroxysteroid dehydrogenase
MGAAHARRFAEEGARVVVADVLEPEGRAVAATLGDVGRFEMLDVTEGDAWGSVVHSTIDRWGGVDVLVNNAGIYRICPLADTTRDLWDQIMAVNATGVFLGMRAVAPHMVTRGSGSIINISSIAGLQASALAPAYGASKWAVRGLTKSAAQEFAPAGVRVNSVHPGIVDTPMAGEFDSAGVRAAVDARIPGGREARPEEVSAVVLFLASDESGYCNGGEFTVDWAMSV